MLIKDLICIKIACFAIDLALSITPALACVSSISNDGSVSGTNHAASKIKCSNGKEWRIWRSSGEWWGGHGAQSGQGYNLNEQASFLCRKIRVTIYCSKLVFHTRMDNRTRYARLMANQLQRANTKERFSIGDPQRDCFFTNEQDCQRPRHEDE